MLGAFQQSLLTAVRARDPGHLAEVLEAHDDAIPARAVVEAGRLAWTRGLELLAARGADLNASYKNYRALHSVIQEKPHEGGSPTPERVRCVTWLLAHGADPELTGAWPAARAMIIAAFVGEPTYVKALMDGGAKTDIFTASAMGDVARVTSYLGDDAMLAKDRDVGGLTALQCCVGSRLGQKQPPIGARLARVTRALIESGAEVNARTRSWGHDVDVAYFAINAGKVEELIMLLDRGADPTAAVPPAAWKGDEATLDLLLQYGATIDQAWEGQRPILNELVRWGQFAQARRLLDRGASPNVADEQGWTALHQAASRGNQRMLEDLLAAGADMSRRDRTGRTARDVARARGRNRLAAILI